MSHRARLMESSTVPSTTRRDQLQHMSRTSRPPTDRSTVTSQRLSMTSNSSSGRRSSVSLDGTSGSTRPSGIPRLKRTSSNTRLNVLATAKPSNMAPLNNRSRPTVNITGIATRTALRNSSVERLIPNNSTPRIVTDEDLLSLEPSFQSLEMDKDIVFSIPVPQKQPPQPANLPPRLIPELQALAAASQRRPTPVTGTFSTVSSPSTQFTTSPGPWSVSTTATTPNSWTSASPSIIPPLRSKANGKRSQTVPIPSTVRTVMPKLPVLQENTMKPTVTPQTSSQNEATSTPKKIKKKTPRSSPAPTPPPRTSSVKRIRSRSNSKSEEQPPPPSQPDSVPPLPNDMDISPLVRHVREVEMRAEPIPQGKTLNDNHKKLQEALNSAPVRPSRDNVDDLEVRRPQRVNLNHNRYDEHARKLLDAAPIESLPHSSSQVSLELSRTSEGESSATAQPPRSRLGKFSRLALFGRSPKKGVVESEPAVQPRKLQRRGPTAGTGHEGYSRFGRRERRTSTDGNNTGTDSETSVVSTTRKAMPSTSADERSASKRRDRSSQSDLDDFAASRLKPKVIVGGSQKSNSGLNMNPTYGVFSETSSDHRQSSSSQDQGGHTSIISSGPLLRESRLIFHLDSLDAHDPSRLALRRSQKFEDPSQFKLPPPIRTDFSVHQPYQGNYNTSQSSIAPTSAALTEASSDFYKTESHASEGKRKKSRKLNWGFFKKKEFTPETYQPRTSSRSRTQTMPVRVSAVPPPRQPPYYAMLDSENESGNTETPGDYMAEVAQTMPMDDDQSSVSLFDDPQAIGTPLETTASIFRPKVPLSGREDGSRKMATMPRSDRPAAVLPGAIPTVESVTMPKRPRLPQVGRIPKVVPTTHAQVAIQAPVHTPVEFPTLGPFQPGSVVYPQPAGPPPLMIHTDLLPSRPFYSPDSGKPASAPIRLGLEHLTAPYYNQARDTGKLPDRYSTTSSSSDGVISVMGPPLLPAPNFPLRSIRYTTTEDDVWNEYDDFIDRVISPPRLKKSTARITNEDRTQPVLLRQRSPVTEKSALNPRTQKELAANTSLVPPPILFSTTPEGDYDLGSEFQLRRAEIVSALHSSMDPSSPFSIGDYLAEAGDPKRDSGRTSGNSSDITAIQTGIRSPRMVFAFPEPPVTRVEHEHYENAVHMNELERSKDPAKHSEKSYASLMVSRWLSFGRVLFSPAHTDLETQPGRHVLVIDGLGNEDWSIYCAVTYQNEHAYIYDLKETGNTRGSISPVKANQAPQNFRRREMASFNEAFNFPENFFSVIVLRFPPVMADSKLKNIISECRRVLAPGGYMELMLLDLDIVNMGVVTRRAMRNLKTQIAVRNREVSLKPVIDNVQSVLGEKGFSKLSKCVVGVPVVGKPPGADSPTSSRSSGASDRLRMNASAGPRPLDGLDKQRHHNFSLNELVADHSDNADAKISRAVSRTARSWWQHCFEAAVISDGNLSKSIFADRQVLQECKSRASSFKLLIAHTQKPAIQTHGSKRRTMSEPSIPALAPA